MAFEIDIDIREALAEAGAGAGASDVIGADGSYVPPGPNGVPFVYGDAQKFLYNKQEEQVASIQSTLAGAGLMPSSYRHGSVTPETIRAYEEVLRISNSTMRSPEVVLRDMSMENLARNLGANVARTGDRLAREQAAGPSRAPFTAQVSNKNDLKRYFRDAVVNATGEYRSQVDIDQMVEAYQAVEQNAQAAAYNTAPSGGVVEAQESIDSFTERTLEEAVPQQVQTRDVVGRAGQLFDMLGSFGGQ